MNYQDDLDIFLGKWLIVEGDFQGWRGLIYHHESPACVFVWGYLPNKSAELFQAHFTVGDQSLVVKPLRVFGNKTASCSTELSGDAMSELIKYLMEASPAT
ncbi:MAG: hypothetical protein ACJAZP_001044 [Psychromonas sp.]|jgi:hypothetical protein|uniref:hypothetical protein n=1 Tax=Psychromonas sp. TaxID=1884585 RepID=UPI0039E2A861